MNLADEIRQQMEKNKGLKLAVGEINNHLSILEGLVRKDIMEQVDEAYQRGLEDAWGCAKKLFSEMSDTEIEKVFPVEWKNGFKGLMQMKPQYAIDKIKDHEAKQKQEDELKYHVGDEFDNGSGRRFVVMKVDDNGEVDRYFDGNGTTYRMDWKYPNMKKTGRRFDISSILKELR